jgi:hypothetical protein
MKKARQIHEYSESDLFNSKVKARTVLSSLNNSNTSTFHTIISSTSVSELQQLQHGVRVAKQEAGTHYLIRQVLL